MKIFVIIKRFFIDLFCETTTYKKVLKRVNVLKLLYQNLLSKNVTVGNINAYNNLINLLKQGGVIKNGYEDLSNVVDNIPEDEDHDSVEQTQKLTSITKKELKKERKK